MANIPSQRTPAEFLADALAAIDSSRPVGMTSQSRTTQQRGTAMSITQKLEIDEFSINRPEGSDLAEEVVWRRNSEVVQKIRDNGENYGRILVSLCVDGQLDIVEADTMQTSDIEALERAIVAMQEVRDALVSFG